MGITNLSFSSTPSIRDQYEEIEDQPDAVGLAITPTFLPAAELVPDDVKARFNGDRPVDITTLTMTGEPKPGTSAPKTRHMESNIPGSALFAWVFQLIGLVLIIVGGTLFWGSGFESSFTMSFGAVGFAIGSFVAIIRGLFGPLASYLASLDSTTGAVEIVDTLRKAQPILVTTITCYHMRRSGFDDEQPRRETTHTESFTFQYDYCVDLTTPLVEMRGLTKLRLIPECGFGDQNTASAYNAQRNRLIESNKHRDDHSSVVAEFRIPGFEVNSSSAFGKDRLLCMSDFSQKPFFVTTGWYVVSAFLFSIFPYEMAFRAVTKKQHIEIKKILILKGAPQPQEQQPYQPQPAAAISPPSSSSPPTWRSASSPPQFLSQSTFDTEEEGVEEEPPPPYESRQPAAPEDLVTI